MNFAGSRYSYYLTRESFETHDEFYTRGWIIAKMEPHTTREMEEAVAFSRLYWSYLQGCEYGQKVKHTFDEWREKYQIQ